jgi:hypothetical protein
VPHTGTQQHSNTATQQHINAATQQRALTTTHCRSRKSRSKKKTPEHTAPELHPPLHCTLNVLVTTEVAHSHDSSRFRRPRTSRTCRLAPRSTLPSHNTRAQTQTPRQATPIAAARKHHGASHLKQRTPTSHTRHIAHSHAAYKHSSRNRPARRPAQPQPLLTAQSSLHAQNRTPAAHSTAHSSDHPTHRQQRTTPSHTHCLRATLTIVQSGCPASTGCCRRVGCCTSTTPCRTHEQPSRHTMAPDAAADPTSHPHRIASRHIASIKSSKMKASQQHCMLSLTHNTVCK